MLVKSSVPNIRQYLNLSVRKAIELQSAIERKDPDEALDLASELTGGFGVEAIRDPEAWVDNYYMDIVLLYVVQGDTYDTTVLYDTDERKFYIGSWGDWIEHAQEEGKYMGAMGEIVLKSTGLINAPTMWELAMREYEMGVNDNHKDLVERSVGWVKAMLGYDDDRIAYALLSGVYPWRIEGGSVIFEVNEFEIPR
jgi:hypothetical protein